MEAKGLLRGNQDKAQTIQVAGFHRQLASSNLSLSLLRSPFPLPSLSSIRFYFFLFRLSSPFPSIPSLASNTFSPRAFVLFIASVSFQAFRTVYKVEALNWKPRLCRRYCGFFFPAVPVSRFCLLPFVAFLSFALTSGLFVPAAWRTVTLAPSREGSP